jgi:hypothetical protein
MLPPNAAKRMFHIIPPEMLFKLMEDVKEVMEVVLNEEEVAVKNNK